MGNSDPGLESSRYIPKHSAIRLLQAACGDEKRNITFEEFKNIIRWRRADEEGGDEEERQLGA